MSPLKQTSLERPVRPWHLALVFALALGLAVLIGEIAVYAIVMPLVIAVVIGYAIDRSAGGRTRA